MSEIHTAICTGKKIVSRMCSKIIQKEGREHI